MLDCSSLVCQENRGQESRTNACMMEKKPLTRRELLKLAALGFGSLALRPASRLFQLSDFPQAERLGRVCYGKWELKARPDVDSETVGVVYDDEVLPWLREVVGNWSIYRNSKRWVETPKGYIWGAYFQPVRNLPNPTVETIPDSSSGPGMWVEVTVPYVDLIPINPPPRHPLFKDRFEHHLPLRFYYSQILWVDQMKTGTDGLIYYRVNEKYGSRGDLYWADGRAFRPLTRQEMEPIHPDVEDKRIEADITWGRQMLSCYEGNSEVYFCRVSSGVAKDSTPLGAFNIWRKLVSLHMEGGTAQAGWDTNGVGWTNLFTSGGVSIHSTYWHNNFGEPESNGCLNVAPDDAKWIFRWTYPPVQYDPGELTITDFSATKVHVSRVT